MTIPDNLPQILTDLQALPCWPKTHQLDSYGTYKFTQGECDEDYPSCDNINDPFFTPWLTSLAMHLLPILDLHSLDDDVFEHISSPCYGFPQTKDTDAPQSIALAIIQAAHAVLVEKE